MISHHAFITLEKQMKNLFFHLKHKGAFVEYSTNELNNFIIHFKNATYSNYGYLNNFKRRFYTHK